MIKIAVCDDEIWAVQKLSGKIKNYMMGKSLACTISSFSSGEALLKQITVQGVVFDAIFLDVKMNQINGIDTAKTIRKTDDKTMLIFVTALKEYVFDAFDVNAVNFLLKPIEDQKLFATLDKVSSAVCLPQYKALVISRNGGIVKVPLAEIVYCEVLNHRVFIYREKCTDQYDSKIEDLEKELDEDFFRCHRSYIVNLKQVGSYSDGIANVVSGEKIPIATRRRQSFMQALLRVQRKEVR